MGPSAYEASEAAKANPLSIGPAPAPTPYVQQMPSMNLPGAAPPSNVSPWAAMGGQLGGLAPTAPAPAPVATPEAMIPQAAPSFFQNLLRNPAR
jgi:hypothetical protein